MQQPPYRDKQVEPQQATKDPEYVMLSHKQSPEI